MRKFNRYLLVLTPAIGMLWAGQVHAEIKRSVDHGGDFIKVLVSDEAWQPDEFDRGLVIPTLYLADADIVLDGIADETAWQGAQEVRVPLSFGKVGFAQVRALYTDEDVVLSIRWPDTSEDRLHRPWVWNEQTGEYEVGEQVEDSLIVSFEAGCEWFPSFLSGYEFDFDGWHWTAGRTDPAGLAVDVSGSMKRTQPPGWSSPFPSRNNVAEWNLKFTDVNDGIIDPANVHMSWDQLDRKYEIWPVDSDSMYFRYLVDGFRHGDFVAEIPAPAAAGDEHAAIAPRFELLELKENARDVQARGNWQDGFWTLELRRKRLTEAGLSWDVQFERMTQLSLHVFDAVEGLDQSSESPRLLLHFVEPPSLLVSE